MWNQKTLAKRVFLNLELSSRSRNTLLVFLRGMMWRLCCFCIISVQKTGGLFVGNLLEIIFPLMPFENFVSLILCNKPKFVTFINNLFFI